MNFQKTILDEFGLCTEKQRKHPKLIQMNFRDEFDEFDEFRKSWARALFGNRGALIDCRDLRFARDCNTGKPGSTNYTWVSNI